MSKIHYQPSTSLYQTICGIERQYEKNHTSQYLDDVTCENCKRTRLFKARKLLQEIDQKR